MRRFKYHFEPKKGWMNDPNGLVWFRGKYHAFFQHNPNDIVWGPMHWGHAISEDLLHWEELEIALYPDTSYENGGGCFSGSAVVKDDRLYLFYTSVAEGNRQTQSVAFSDDGIHFTKYEGNPVIDHFPQEDATEDFRDPKVFAYEGTYRMIVGSVFAGKGRILQYRSTDLLHWDYLGVLYESEAYDKPIECPDLFCVDNRWILMFSKIGFETCQEQFILGAYDGNTFTPQTYITPEFGPQFYAAQTFEDGRGRRILIGWFFDWQRKAAPDDVSAGSLTLPRQIRVNGEGLQCAPIEEAEALLKKLDLGVTKDQCDMNGLGVYIQDGKLVVRQEISGKSWEFQDELTDVRLLEDQKGIELFINGGSKVVSILG